MLWKVASASLNHTPQVRVSPRTWPRPPICITSLASKGGMPNHPVWLLNLEAEPHCDLMVGAQRVSARARVAEGEERARIWDEMAEIYPPYNDYQAAASNREIPVVVLERQ